MNDEIKFSTNLKKKKIITTNTLRQYNRWTSREKLKFDSENDATPQSEKKEQPLFIPREITHWNTATLTNEI